MGRGILSGKEFHPYEHPPNPKPLLPWAVPCPRRFGLTLASPARGLIPCQVINNPRRGIDSGGPLQLLVLPSLPEEMLVMLPVPRPWAVLLENKLGAAHGKVFCLLGRETT